jgi:polysaccharide pyruvyl transferase WcaK-like protein
MTRHFVMIGDVGGAGAGGDGYHAGDEAMLDSAIHNLRERGDVMISVISSTPTDTSARYGVRALRRIGFSVDTSDGQRDRQLNQLLADAVDTTPVRCSNDTALAELIDTLRHADGVIVAGGGNLSSSWPAHVYERVALLFLADRLGVPAVVSGQTIGPNLSKRQSELLGSALGTAKLVGVRERASFDLAATLVPAAKHLLLQLDDAWFLGPNRPAPADLESVPGADWIAVTLNRVVPENSTEELMDGLALTIRAMRAATGAPIMFLPHVGSRSPRSTGDVSVGDSLRHRLSDDEGFTVAPLLGAREIAWLTRRASLVVSTRFHPLVFGLSGGVPALALYQNRYTETKLVGALEHAGLSGWKVPVDAALTPLVADAASELWRRRVEIAEHLRTLQESWRESYERHWDRIWAALGGTGCNVPAEPSLIQPHVRELSPGCDALVTMNAVVGALQRRSDDDVHRWRTAFGEAEHYAVSLEDELTKAKAALQSEQLALRTQIDDARRERAEAEAKANAHLDDLQAAEFSAAAARRLTGEAMARLRAVEAIADEQRAHLDKIERTKVMRWSRAARRLYASIRHRVVGG